MKRLLACSSWFWSMAALLLAANIAIAHPGGHGLEKLTGKKSSLADGERIVFLGDSITQAGVKEGGYVNLIEKAIAENLSSKKVEVIGAGISGNKVPDLQARLERDVLSKQPTVVFIYIGINDVWHSIRDNGTPVEKFESGLNDIISQIKKAGATVVLATPSVIGEKAQGSNPLDVMLDKYSDISRKVAQEQNVYLCDLRVAFISHLKKHNAEDKDRGILTSDTVHLNAAGNEFVANKAAGCLNEALAQRDGGDKQASKSDKEEGFKPLFNGKNLEGWTLSGGKGPGYVVKDGILVCPRDGGGNLYTDDTYSDFVLRFEFRMEPGGNNGIGIRLPREGHPSYQGMEIQILDDDAEKYATLKPFQYHGSIYGVVPAKRGSLKKAGEWNTQEIVCDGRNIKVTVNGKVIVDANLDDVKDEKVIAEHPGIKRDSGHIALLGHGALVEFRDMRIKRLDK